ncbi:unnamed protein product [Gadus morhua 'NCC']
MSAKALSSHPQLTLICHHDENKQGHGHTHTHTHSHMLTCSHALDVPPPPHTLTARIVNTATTMSLIAAMHNTTRIRGSSCSSYSPSHHVSILIRIYAAANHPCFFLPLLASSPLFLYHY